MNIIKGLIIKDILQLKTYKKTLIIFILIFTLTSISGKNGVENMTAIILTLGFGMFSMASFNFDEINKSDRYILTLPLTKKQVIISKYTLVICSTAMGSIVGIILGIIVSFAINKQFPNITELISVGIGGIFGIGLIQAIQIPCVYKWGAEKGRIQMVIVTAAVLLLVGGIMFVIKNANIQLPINNIIKGISAFLPLILIVATFIMYYISYRVSYKIYDRKEL